MSLAKESYKGIEFVRVSSLTIEQRKLFWKTFDHRKVIKILKSDSLLNDCVLLQDFLTWESSMPAGKTTTMPHEVPTQAHEAA